MSEEDGNDVTLRLIDVRREYDEGRVVALRGVTMDVHRGERVAVVGPSGSGKSTLLNMFSGLDQPTGGRVLFEGHAPVNQLEWTRIRARHIGFVFQDFNLLSTFTALENVQIPMFGVVPTAGARSARAHELLRRVGLASRTQHYPSQLSGGERQRVAIARSLANTPRLILADEPTGNLDSRTSGEILDLIQEIHDCENTTLIMVTHDRRVSERAERVVNILDGSVVPDGHPE